MIIKVMNEILGPIYLLEPKQVNEHTHTNKLRGNQTHCYKSHKKKAVSNFYLKVNRG